MSEVQITKDVETWCDWIRQEPRLQIDTETKGLDLWDEVVTVQAGNGKGDVWILDTRGYPRAVRQKTLDYTPTWHGTKIQQALHGKALTMHNAVFDLCRLITSFGCVVVPPGDFETRLWDTMMAEQVLTTGRINHRADLGACIRRYTGQWVDKDHDLAKSMGWTYGDFGERQIQYMANDVRYLHRIEERQRLSARVLRLADIVELESQLLPVLADMEVTGFHLDGEKWEATLPAQRAERQKWMKELEQLVAPYFGGIQATMFDGMIDGRIEKALRSPVQLKHVFEEYLGYELEKVDSDTLEILQMTADHPLAVAMLEFREHEKYISMAESIAGLRDQWGFVHPQVKSILKTGRTSMKNPNAQNIPGDPKVRACFTAPDGFMMVICDYSQMELRILADRSGDPTMIRAYHNGEDLHKKTAARAYGIPEEKVTKEQRRPSKNTNFASLYGVAATKLSRMLTVTTKQVYTKKQAQVFLDAFRDTFPQAYAWLQAQQRHVLLDYHVRTPLGRIRWFDLPHPSNEKYDIIIGSLERQAANQPIQGGNADATKMAMIRIYHDLGRIGGRLCNMVHDELVAYAPANVAEQAGTLVSEHMIAAAETFISKVPIEAKPDVYDHWYKEP